MEEELRGIGIIILGYKLTPAHIFNCSATLATLQDIGAWVSSTNLYGDNIEQIISHLGPWYTRKGPKKAIVESTYDPKEKNRQKDSYKGRVGERKLWGYVMEEKKCERDSLLVSRSVKQHEGYW
ncbi:hypothetical protein TNCV_3840531 [Trichonephila clavipes]|nr:hypothetical protein TNCV_3840531 [Trichonephila clavipes]